MPATQSSAQPPPLPYFEFVALLATMLSLIALSIDAMLPALAEMGKDLGVGHINDTQLIIVFLLAGLAFGQLFYGPIADSRGRKPAIYAGYCLFIAGTLLALYTDDFQTMLFARFLQGAGAAGPRSVSMALVRDQFHGNEMAKIMSFTTAVFILVPALAPSLGQLLLLLVDWRGIFVAFLIIALISASWFGLRQRETLCDSNRIPFSWENYRRVLGVVFSTRSSVAYALAIGFIYSPFIGYLASSRQIFQDQYGVGTDFPLYFAAIALSLGGASLVNANLVTRLGMEKLVRIGTLSATALSMLFLPWALYHGGHPPLWTLMAYLLCNFFFIGLLFGNLNTLAMGPLGNVAGVGASIIGALSMALSIPAGSIFGMVYDGTINVVIIAFAGFTTAAWLATEYAKHWQRRNAN